MPVPSPSSVMDRLTYSRFICISKLFLNYAGQSVLPVAKSLPSGPLPVPEQPLHFVVPEVGCAQLPELGVQKRQASRSLGSSARRLLSGRTRTVPGPLSQAGQEPRGVKGQSQALGQEKAAESP